MKTVKNDYSKDIRQLYKKCGIDANSFQVNNVLNRGNLNSKLNCDFSNVYGSTFSNSSGNSDVIVKKR